MIKVLRVNKQGNRIISYTCTDGKKTNDITKDQLINLITNKKVSNARMQVYKGTTIIRLTDEPPVNTTEKVESDYSNGYGYIPSGTVNPEPAKQAKPIKQTPTIMDYIEKAKDKGIKNLDLSNITVNTSTLEIKKTSKTPKQTISEPVVATAEAVYDTAPITPTVNTSKTLSDKVKELVESKISYGVYCGIIRDKWAVAEGIENDRWVVGLFNPETRVFKSFYTFEDRFDHNVIIAGNFVVVFDLVYNHYARTKIFKVSPNGSIGCLLSDEVDGFSTGMLAVNRLDDRFIMANGDDTTMIIDLDYMTISSKHRDSYTGILDPITSSNRYYITINECNYSESSDYVDLKVKSTFYEEKENYLSGRWSKDYLPTHMKTGYYIQFRVFRDHRGVKVTLHDNTGKQIQYDFEAIDE